MKKPMSIYWPLAATWDEGVSASENMAQAEERIVARYELSGCRPSVIRMDTVGTMRALYDTLLARGLPMAKGVAV